MAEYAMNEPKNMPSYSASFGQWLRQVRKAAGRTQQEVGEVIGRDQSKISDLERGVSPSLNAAEVRAIAEFLNASTETALKLSGNWEIDDAGQDDPRTARMSAAWRRLTDDKRDAVLTLVESIAKAA